MLARALEVSEAGLGDALQQASETFGALEGLDKRRGNAARAVGEHLVGSRFEARALEGR